jgi:aspartokinase-like uncharacterized kinase
MEAPTTAAAAAAAPTAASTQVGAPGRGAVKVVAGGWTYAAVVEDATEAFELDAPVDTVEVETVTDVP